MLYEKEIREIRIDYINSKKYILIYTDMGFFTSDFFHHKFSHGSLIPFLNCF
jgi:hypothetical protein